jgi:predicted nucleotidyltransferase
LGILGAPRHNRPMDRSTIIAKLREHEAELRASGVEHLSLFGSYARGTAVQAISDVDLMADFDRGKRLTLFSLSGLRLLITDILEMPVDLADRRMLKEQVKAHAEREAVLVF